jgi:plastocyanin
MTNLEGRGMRATERAGRRHGTRGAVAAVLVAAVGLLCVVLLLPLTASTTDSAREITLVARNMAFYLEGGTEPNPTIQVRAGEEVRFTVLNRDPGFVHNFVVDAWDLETPFIEAEASTTVVVRAPARPGRREYVCTPHGNMMRGVIEVVGGD